MALNTKSTVKLACQELKEALKEKGIVAPEPVLAETQAEETLMQKIKSALPFIGGKVKKD